MLNMHKTAIRSADRRMAVLIFVHSTKLMILTVNFLNGILIPIQIIRMINFDQVFITFLKDCLLSTPEKNISPRITGCSAVTEKSLTR